MTKINAGARHQGQLDQIRRIEGEGVGGAPVTPDFDFIAMRLQASAASVDDIRAALVEVWNAALEGISVVAGEEIRMASDRMGRPATGDDLAAHVERAIRTKKLGGQR